MNLKKKHILFISVKLFSYEKYILNKLIELGCFVTYYDERPKNTILVKVLIRIKRNLYQYKINKYYNKILKEISFINFDYFFLIKGEVIPFFFLNQIKKNNPGIITIFYTFDSFVNNPNAVKILPFFDKKFTFDNLDSINYNLKLRPLFFINNYKIITENKYKKVVDILFIGTAHSDRLTIANKIRIFCNNSKLVYHEYLYYHNKLIFLFLRIFDKSLQSFRLDRISFKPLSHNDIVSLYSISNSILDINHPDQNGLTMRVFEALGAKKKIITTNHNIRLYPFYNSNNIYVIDRMRL